MCLCCVVSETLKMRWDIGCKKWSFYIRMINSSWVSITVIFFLFLAGVFFYKFLTTQIKDITHWIAILLTSFGSIFIALKYKLDQASYQKDIFEERFHVFTVIDTILFDCFQGKDPRDLKVQLDSVYRRGYFLFGMETNKFLTAFSEAVVNFSHYKNSSDPKAKAKADKAHEFLKKLLGEQHLAKKFPELNIDLY